MKTLINILLIVFFIQKNSFSQNYWAYTAGSIKEDEAMDICYDNTGNIISTGYIAGSTVFSSGVILNSNSNGNPDIYISKSNAFGQIIWAKKAGGSGSDRGLSVKSDANGNIYITGFYYGVATFGTYTLTSVNNSQDGFLAKLDANGNFVWAQSFGGNLAEWGNAIAVDELGNVIITGQFQGSSTFSSTTLTSMINPNTFLPSFDVFTAKYNSTGNLVWVNKGSAKYDDRGLDIITDNLNNIYVCGQFSDTVQFQNTHNNQIMNASFFIKYNAAGQEQWFRKASGVFSIPYSMIMDNNNKIYVTGDFQGTYTYFGNTGNSFINGTYTNKAFLMKIDNNGNFIWGKSESSSNYVSGKQVALDAQQDPYIFGEFGCTMNEYSDAYGPGIFNSIGFGDLFITKYNNSGTRQWFKHYGGPRNDKAHGLLVAGINEPIMAGSFEHHLNIPSTNGNLIAINNYAIYSNSILQPNTYCSSNNNYTDYYPLSCKGYSDAFIFKGIDLTRNPYDYYDRSGSICNLNFVGNCIENYSINNCPDTINVCNSGYIYSNTHNNGFDINQNNFFNIGPINRFKWNNNPIDTFINHYVTSSGYNTVIAKTIDNCYTSYDTVYVKINTSPAAPVITDSYSVNILQPPATNSIHICGPATVTLTGGNVSNTNYSWSTNGNGAISNNDSILVINNSGNYTFSVFDQNGCYNQNQILIQIDSPPLPFTPFGLKQITDSVIICKNQSGVVLVYDTISNPSGVIPYPCIMHQSYIPIFITNGLSIQSTNYCDFHFAVSAQNTGWYKYKLLTGLSDSSLCGATNYTTTLTDSIYIKVNPLPLGSINVSGNILICPGDSTLLPPPSVTISSANTIYTITPSTSIWVYQQNSYSYYLNLLDTLSGCTNSDLKSIAVIAKPNPFIILSPYNSIICPNDSMKLTINLPNATNYEWHGPTGLIPINSQSIYSQIAGFYHCIVTDNTGCVFTTNTIELKQYATPYLTASPTTFICNNQPITLTVNTLDATQIVWNAPLSGGGAVKTITTPGLYSCQVTMCGITTSLSINILGSNPTANITTYGTTTVCPFDSVLLTGNNGMTNYVWQPGNHLGQNYVVHSPGSYTLEVTDIYGCTAKSTPVTVAFSTTVSPPTSIQNDTICAGQTATLSANSSGNTLHWFPNSNSGNIINTGNTYVTPTLSNQTTYYVASVNNTGCHSIGVPATVYIYSTSFSPTLITDTTVCMHYSLTIYTPYIYGATYNWSGPGITNNNTNHILISNSDSTNSGLYTLQITGFGCSSPTSSTSIQVLNPQSPTMLINDSICQGNDYSIVIPNQPNITYEWQGPNNYTNSGDTMKINNALINHSGTYSVTTNLLGCLSTASTLQLTVIQTPLTPTISGNSIVCEGNSVTLTATSNIPSNYYWYGTNGVTGNGNSITFYASDTSYSGYYGVIAQNLFCPSGIVYDTIKVIPTPILQATNDTLACDNSAITLSCSSNYGNYIWNTGSVNSSISVTQSGTYWVSSQNGICSSTDTIHVSFIPCSGFYVNVFTPNGDGVNDIFMFKSKAINQIQCTIQNRWGEKIGEFNDVNNGWNGKNLINNSDCENGTYFYIAEITTIDGVKSNIKGFVTLIR